MVLSQFVPYVHGVRVPPGGNGGLVVCLLAVRHGHSGSGRGGYRCRCEGDDGCRSGESAP
jgi:hypothetical protein